MTRINTNVSSFIAQKTLARNNSDLQTALTRLSTGLRINVGKDDPAGLIASENLRRDITSIEKAITNTERANQVIATADSALGQVSGLLNDIRGLVSEAANSGVLSDEQISANQLQVDSSLEAIDRISQTTTFQNRRLLDGSLSFLVQGSTGYSSVSNLRIDQATIGAAGAVDVNVSIASAATQAIITNAIPDNSSGQFAIGNSTFTINTTAASGLNAVNVALDVRTGPEATGVVSIDGHDFSIKAASGQSIDNVTVDLAVGSAAHFARGTLTLDQTQVTLRADSAQTFDNTVVSVQKSALGATADSSNVIIGDGTNSDTFTLAATTAGAAAGADNINIVVNEVAGPTAADYDSGTNTLTISVDNTAATTSGAIATAIAAATLNGSAAATPLFTASAAAGGTTIDASTGVAALGGSSDTTLTREEATAAYNASSNTLTITLNSDLANVSTVDLLAAVNGLTEFSGSTASGPTNVATANVTASATFGTLTRPGVLADYGVTSAGELTLKFDNLQSGIDIADVISAIDGLTEFTGTTSTSSSGTINGVTLSAANDAATLTRLTTGVRASFSSTTDTLTLTVDGSNSSILTSNVVSAIDGLTEFENTGSTGDTTIDGTELESNSNVATAGRVQDLVIRVAGELGSEVLSFEAGSTYSQIASAIQLISDATGVSARVSGSSLELKSSRYGSRGVVDVEVISEGPGGTFADNLSATRANGSDIVARVNGVQARGQGNELSINTSTLDLSLTVDAGTTGDVNFTINGGGAVFQLGPDVVTNQQARIAIDSIATGKLGGVSGQLYELRSGGAAALNTEPSRAARIVDEVISKVTQLRGRLGAFQRTTLDTNVASLNDTLANLTESESSIRDADFAAESARLTRAQILVQSSSQVLSIANSNPQNVLALLR